MKREVILLALTMISVAPTFAQVWNQKADYPYQNGGDGSMSFTLDSKVYIAGGFDSKKLFQYDPATNKWAEKNELPGVDFSRAFGTAFVLNGKAYVGLGLDINLSTFIANCKKDLWEYDPGTDSWTQKASYPGFGCDGHFSFVYDGMAYVGGGEKVRGPSQKDMYMYDPVIDQWTAKAPFPDSNGVVSPFSFVSGKQAIVSCGMYTDGNAETEVPNTFAYDPKINQWTKKSPFSGDVRQGGVSFVVNGKAYCGWGYAKPSNYFTDFFSYDPVSDYWKQEFIAQAIPRGFASAIALNGNVYLGLGWTSDTVYYDWWELTFPTGRRQLHAELNLLVYPNPAQDHLYISGNGELFYKLYNPIGELIKRGRYNNDGIEMEMLPPGIYYLQVRIKHNTEKYTIVKVH